MSWIVKVVVKLKEGVLDVQGRAVEQALKHLGYNAVSNVKVGKYLEFLFSKEPSENELREMAEKLLVNPVIETAEFFVEKKTS
jgi:phosphoribosylformylglycinamidine synthase PurS subunit